MSEVPSTQEESQQMESETMKETFQGDNSPHGGSREPLWGMFVIAGMLLFVVASIAGIGWAIYSNWHSARIAKSQPSIASLQEQAVLQETTATEPAQENTNPATDVQKQDTAASLESAKKLDISVLNGGGAKGSAGTLAEFLKTEGYAKVSAGNTVKDYSGTVVYYGANLEKEAGVINGSVTKKYSQAKMLPADTNNKETTTSPITIIIGK